MERRTFLALVPAGLLAAPVAGGAQPAAKLWRIGFLDQGSLANNRPYVDGLRRRASATTRHLSASWRLGVRRCARNSRRPGGIDSGGLP